MILRVVKTSGWLSGVQYVMDEIELETTSIQRLKELISTKTGIPPMYQKLVFLGKLMEPDHATCHTVMRDSLLRGHPCGMIHLAPNNGSGAAREAFAKRTCVPPSIESERLWNRNTTSDGKMTIFYKPLNDRTYTLDAVTPETTVQGLKSMLQFKESYPPADIDLVFNCQCLREGFCLSDYQVTDSSLLHVILSIRKGIGSAKAVKRRNARVLKPFLTSLERGLAWNVIPKALERVGKQHADCMFAAVQQTVGMYGSIQMTENHQLLLQRTWSSHVC